MGWLEEVAGPNFAPAVLWTLLALVVLAVVLIAIRVIRSMTSGTFVAGGRNRKTRLAVMDAAAVDSHRRLVLVRRDDVEHLILIGGPTDLVVERDIRLHAPARRPAPPPADSSRPVQVARQAAEPAPSAAPRPEPRRMPVAAKPDHEVPLPTTRAAPPQGTPVPPAKPIPFRQPVSNHGSDPGASRHVQTVAAHAPPPTPRMKAEIEKAPAQESSDVAKKPAKPVEMSLEDEMNRLLGELSAKK